jgi:hypothetical protein
MRPRITLCFAVGAVALLVGCSEDARNNDGLIEPRTGSLVGVPGAPSCSNQTLNTIKGATRDLFGQQAAENTLAGQLTRTGQATNVPIGFQLIRSIATLRNGSPTWSSTQAGLGATITVNLIWCMDVAVTAPVSEISLANFTSALGDQGLYEVRGGSGAADESTAIARDGLSGIGPIAPATFASHLGGEALIYGREITNSGLAPNAGRRYDLSLVRSSKAALAGLTARTLCSEFDVSNRIEHKSGTLNTILPEVPEVLSCPTDLAATASTGLLEKIATFLLPQKAFARRGTGSKTGGAGGYSPHWLVNPGAVTLSFVQQPKNGKTNTDNPVSVKAVGNNVDPTKPGVAWEGVDVRLDAFNNNGSWVCSTGNIAETNAQGIASFPNFQLNKPGGYSLTATTLASSDGDGTQNGNYTGASSSNRFNLQQGPAGSGQGDVCP